MTRIHADVFAVSFSAERSFRSAKIREIRGHFTGYFIRLNSYRKRLKTECRNGDNCGEGTARRSVFIRVGYSYRKSKFELRISPAGRPLAGQGL